MINFGSEIIAPETAVSNTRSVHLASTDIIIEGELLRPHPLLDRDFVLSNRIDR